MTPGLHPDQDIAADILTDTQLVRWVLRHIRGWSIDRIAKGQCVSKQSVRDSLEAADRKISRWKEQP